MEKLRHIEKDTFGNVIFTLCEVDRGPLNGRVYKLQTDSRWIEVRITDAGWFRVFDPAEKPGRFKK